MQLVSPILAYKCSMMSLGNPFVLDRKFKVTTSLSIFRQNAAAVYVSYAGFSLLLIPAAQAMLVTPGSPYVTSPLPLDAGFSPAWFFALLRVLDFSGTGLHLVQKRTPPRICFLVLGHLVLQMNILWCCRAFLGNVFQCNWPGRRLLLFFHVSTDYAFCSFASLLAVDLLCIIFAVDLRRRILFFQSPRTVSSLAPDAKNIYYQYKLDL